MLAVNGRPCTKHFVARGLAPVGLRSRPLNQATTVVSDTPQIPDLRLLCSRTGASPLATSASISLIIGASVHHFALHIFFTLANHRLSLSQVRSICVNGSVDYGRFVANRFE
ncbi:hypothetical protein EMIT0P43_60315 [Pseudomonas jessenii]